ILNYMNFVAVDGGEDHRLHPWQLHQGYWVAQTGQPSGLKAIFDALSAGQPEHDSQVMLGYRCINVVLHSDAAEWWGVS
ncbi:cell division protein ZapE, partial [Pseudomonas syringae pv. tagetis]